MTDKPIGRIWRPINSVEKLEHGCQLEFDRRMGWISDDDEIVLTLADGTERTLYIEGPIGDGKWSVSHMRGYFTIHLTLERVGLRQFRLLMEPHQEEMAQTS